MSITKISDGNAHLLEKGQNKGTPHLHNKPSVKPPLPQAYIPDTANGVSLFDGVATLPEYQQSAEVDFSALLAEAEIDPFSDSLPPHVAFSLPIREEGTEPTYTEVATMGNFSAIIGKAKSRKSFFISAFAAAALSGEAIGIKSSLPDHKKGILYFDTEQSEYHVNKACKRIMKMAGITSASDQRARNFRPFHLRKHPAGIRQGIIDHAINSINGVGLVIIDGVRDITFDINDSQEASETVTKLMQWTEERECHLITILHQNKGDNNARGHLGTEVINKAESVISVTKDSDDEKRSIVNALFCRGVEFTPFAFRITEGIPAIDPTWDPDERPARSRGRGVEMQIERPKKGLDALDLNTRLLLLQKVYENQDSIGYGEVKSGLIVAAEYFGHKLGSNAAVNLITYLKSTGYLIEQKKPGQRFPSYEPAREKIAEVRAESAVK